MTLLTVASHRPSGIANKTWYDHNTCKRARAQMHRDYENVTTSVDVESVPSWDCFFARASLYSFDVRREKASTSIRRISRSSTSIKLHKGQLKFANERI